MQRRFTLLQGGLSAQAPGPAASTADWRPVRWRVVLRRPSELDEAEIAAWRALAGRGARVDPFADPDLLVTAARHDLRSRDLVFALAFAVSETEAERLGGMLPLERPHPHRDGAAFRLWHSPLIPHPVSPLVETGAAPAAFEAVLCHLRARHPQASLCLRLAQEGGILDEVRADSRLRLVPHPDAQAIPEHRFVAVAARERAVRSERAARPEAIRDAVERFLLAEAGRARRPLLADPAAASTLRVATRLLARRGLAEAELGYDARGEVVSGAIRIGPAGARVLWRSVGLAEPLPSQPRTVEVGLALAEDGPSAARAAALRLVAP